MPDIRWPVIFRGPAPAPVRDGPAHMDRTG